LESHLSVVITGHLFIHFKSVLFLSLGAVTVLIVGFSRVYSRARFPHQVVGSWLSGLAGLLLSMHCCEKMSFHT
jgi:membrane-associated phospholipid phosphatase